MYNIGLVYSDLSSLRILGRVKYVSNPITVMDELRDPVTEIDFFSYERYHFPEEVSLPILTSTIVGEDPGVFNNYPGPKN